MRFLSIVVAALLVNLSCALPVNARIQAQDQTKTIDRVKAAVAKLGSRPDARVQVKLRDKTKIKGYIGEITEEHFTVRDASTGATRTISYSDVAEIKGLNHSKGSTIAEVVIITVGILALLTFLGTRIAE